MLLAKPLQHQQGHPGPRPSTSRWRPPHRRPGRPERSLGPLHLPAYRTQRAGSKSALVASASVLAGGPARRTNVIFFFSTEDGRLGLVSRRARGAADAIADRCYPPAAHGAVGRAPPPERLPPIRFGHGKKKKKNNISQKSSAREIARESTRPKNYTMP